MNKILFIALASAILPAFLAGQDIFLTRTGIASFTSNAPLEVIKASSDIVQGAINLEEKTIVFTVDNKSFKGFNSPLQQEHFYENYMEIQTHPTSVFQGKIIEDIDRNSGLEQVVRVKGTLSIHGVDQERIIKGTMRMQDDRIIIHSDFTVPLEDHNIKIPRIVNQKIAEVIDVSISAEMKRKSD